MRVDAFDFDLPKDRIALRPIEPRDAARLLHIGPGLADLRFRDLPALLAPGDIVVLNDTKVIPAQLRGRRGEAGIDVTLHQREGPGRWRAFARPAKRLRPGDGVRFGEHLEAIVQARGDGGEVVLDFALEGAALDQAIGAVGTMPLPPYIARRRPIDGTDRADYQTVFARHEGAVAAPTAGLHLTTDLLAALRARDIGIEFATLHVGAGTFLPVKTDDTDQHRMHSEWCRLTPAAAERINQRRAAGGQVVAVGTTALRLLETAADADGRLAPFEGTTDLFIVPGYRFRGTDRLITNFHLPRSTLFMLVAAFGGLARMKAAYAHAVANGYRFYSYGDACLIEPEPVG